MFEDMRPMLLMRTYPGTLLDATCRMAVKRQIAYGRERGVAWGISESAFNLTDLHGNYQYKAFGIPGLGFKRGLGTDLGIEPYATALATLVAPHEAAKNLERLASEGARGAYGYYEAIDCTPRKRYDAASATDTPLPKQESCVVVKAYLAHHQGMTMVALTNALLGDVMVARFHADPRVKATELLLQERIPRSVPIMQPLPAEETRAPPSVGGAVARVLRTPHTPFPRAAFLSNAAYVAAIPHPGGVASPFRGMAVTRWRQNHNCDEATHVI